MLNLPIVMRAFLLFLVLFLQDSPVVITAPQPGAEVRGLIEIQGRMDSPDFSSAELAFTYDTSASDPAAGWFPIQIFTQSIANPVIASWDTTAVTDGDYTLRLRVFLKDGSTLDAIVKTVKIRNDEPLPTATLPPTLADFNFQPLDPAQGAVVDMTPTQRAVVPAATPLPANPASLKTSSISNIFWQSALAALLLFAFFSLVLRLRKP